MSQPTNAAKSGHICVNGESIPVTLVEDEDGITITLRHGGTLDEWFELPSLRLTWYPDKVRELKKGKSVRI